MHELDAAISLAISDDGIGGADPTRGSGLIGLRDRVEALGGTLELRSEPGSGTELLVRLPTAPPALEVPATAQRPQMRR
jgi:signal transduction histidine kinase